MPGVPGSTKSNPYAGPMYSPGTKEMDTKDTVGKVHGPKTSLPVPDPMGYRPGQSAGSGKK